MDGRRSVAVMSDGCRVLVDGGSWWSWCGDMVVIQGSSCGERLVEVVTW